MKGALDLDSRRRIYDLIRARPGTYLREMERELGMQVGMLTHHLRVLTEAGLIRAVPEGNHVRYFTEERFVQKDSNALSYLRTRTSRDILIYVLDRETIRLSELIALTGMTKSTMSYHLKRLNAAGMIRVDKGEFTTVSAVDPERLVNLLVWVREDVERDPAGALIDAWNRLTER